MRVAVAPNAFRGGPSAERVARALEDGVRDAAPHADIVVLPLSDGGDGAVDVAHRHLGGTIVAETVTGPLGTPVEARYVRTESNLALVAMAEASGLGLVPPDARDPLGCTTRGTGELVLSALRGGATEIVLCAGGSPTVDMGAGALDALGARFRDASGRALGVTPRELVAVAHVDPPTFDGPRITVLSDVATPLARNVATFGAQKGLDAAGAALVAELLRRLERALHRPRGALLDAPWLGAGGGLAAGFAGLLGAPVRSGSAWFIERCGAREAIASADLVLTAEGRFDRGSLDGKLPVAVAGEARRAGVRAAIVAASADSEAARVAPAAVLNLGLAAHEPGDRMDEALEHGLRKAAASAVVAVEVAA